MRTLKTLIMMSLALALPAMAGEKGLDTIDIKPKLASFQTFSGVLMVEAAKQIYASTIVQEKPKKARVYVPLPQGLRRAADPADRPRVD